MRIATVAGVLLVLAFVVRTPAHAADVHIGVNIGVPTPPPIVFEAEPRLVVVPAVPRVRYAPDVSVNFFVYGGRYWTWHDDRWFAAGSYGGPWEYVPVARVPRPVRVVPVRYYRAPPRWVKKAHGYQRGHDRGHHPKGSGHRR